MRNDKAIKFYKLAKNMAEIMSKDDSTKVGAIILKPDTLEILSMGYNGMPRGIDETIKERWERPLKYKYVEHSERNAIYNAARSGTSLLNSICVVTMFPCVDCARGLIQSGIKLIVSEDYNKLTKSDDNDDRIKRWIEDWNESLSMFKDANVEVMLLDPTELI